MERHIQQWEKLGASDPYWAVLTHPDRKNGRWTKQEFFESGEAEIAALITDLENSGIKIDSAVALDFGCGVGRLSRALSYRFSRVIGVDISSTMLAEAKSANSDIKNLEFSRVEGSRIDGIADESVTFIYSNMVLQHSPRQVQKAAVREFFRILAPDGIAVFQTPSCERFTPKGIAHMVLGTRLLNFLRAFRYGKDSIMEIHTMPESMVLDTIFSSGAVLLKSKRLDLPGDNYISMMYFAKRVAKS